MRAVVVRENEWILHQRKRVKNQKSEKVEFVTIPKIDMYLTAIPCKTGPIMENPKTNFFDHLYGNQ